MNTHEYCAICESRFGVDPDSPELDPPQLEGHPIPQRSAAAARTSAVRRLTAVPAAGRKSFDVFESKLRVPPLTAGMVSRTGIVNRLRAERSLRLVKVAAPAGYGKTTLMAQWAARDGRPFVWVSVDERDNDPLVLLRHLAAALERVAPIDPPVADELATESLWKVAAPRLANAFGTCDRPFVAVLDDADLIRGGDSAGVLAALAENVPEGSVLVVTGRTTPRIGIPRLRAERRLLELGPGELELGGRETQLLLRGVGVEVDSRAVTELRERAEGWPGGLYLLARDLADGAAAGDGNVTEYFESEVLASVTPELRAFLRRTSLLDRMCGPLCDAVTGSDGSSAQLRALERAALFLAPLDGRRLWYRYHRLFRETLVRELEEHEPELVPVLHRRAADWFEARGELEGALGHVQAYGDAGRAARILSAIALPVYRSGRAADVDDWLDRFAADASLGKYPEVAALGAWIHALRGSAEQARTWLAAADCRSGLAALLPVALCDDPAKGVDAATLPGDSPWVGMAHLLRGGLDRMRGDETAARTSFAAAERAGAADVRIAALGAGSLAAGSAGDHAAAERLALEARELVVDRPLAAYPTSAIAHAAAAPVFLRRGRWDDARRELAAAEPLARQLLETLPWLAFETLLALAAAYLALRDRAATRERLADLDDLVARHPCLAGLGAHVAGIRRELDELPDVRDGRSSGLTAAELRLLPLLATHLSFREIGDRLYVSRNTIKTQAISAYRKLGVSSRSAAIERACELGLIDDATTAPNGFTQPG